MLKLILVLFVLGASINGFAGPQSTPHPANCGAMKIGPACEQICNACAGGFIVDDANIGDGFWADE